MKWFAWFKNEKQFKVENSPDWRIIIDDSFDSISARSLGKNVNGNLVDQWVFKIENSGDSDLTLLTGSTNDVIINVFAGNSGSTITLGRGDYFLKADFTDKHSLIKCLNSRRTVHCFESDSF